ncbi:hypothetical protein BDW69DRAFT_153830 [Aspergillus filifer]
MHGNGSVLHRAVLKDNEKLARLLVDHALPAERIRVLAFSTQFHVGRIAQMLLEYGTKPEFQFDETGALLVRPGDEGITGDVVPPLVCAIRFRNTKLVPLLIDHGAVFNQVFVATHNGFMCSGSPLLLARQLKLRKTVDFLCALKAYENSGTM